ncbi:MAG: TonB-dependent receptor, partial [Saprospiraceae bacterium]|nr:TonB-dependent receptor [Saprospiraceae bacterium]
IQNGQAQLSLNESLMALPGIFTLNGDNFSQDLRIAVRGFGARSAFGIRGIRLFVDGLPESTPDGQADVDNVDAGALQKLELLRGASAGLYGNASGGVLNMATEEPTARPFVEVQGGGGSFGFQRFQAKTGFKIGKLGVFSTVSQNKTEGYRAQSAMQQTTVNLKMRYALSPTAKLSLLVNYGKSPYAKDAGGLTKEQVAADRRQARVANAQFDAGEAVEQGRVGLVFDKEFSEKHSLKARAYTTMRDFENRLAFKAGGWVAFQRLLSGGGVTYAFNGQKYRSQVGVELNNQRDNRQRFDNDNGKKAALTFDQIEKYSSTGVFWLNEYSPITRLTLTAATRYDRVTVSADDHFLTDGNQSGSQKFNSVNPSLGLVYQLAPSVNFYTNVASNFETPTLNELSANPTNLGGFNSELKPQKSINYELGAKIQAFSRLSLDVALFQIKLQDELVPYQLSSAIGRTFYRNAGRSDRKGVEVAAQVKMTDPKDSNGSGVVLMTNYTYSDFKYTSFTANTIVFDGKRQPAIPQHSFFSALQWVHHSGLYATGQVRTISQVFVDDANAVTDKGYTLVSIRGGYRLKLGQSWVLEPFGGVNNLFNTAYTNNILINAVANRFFEPAADKATYYGGLKIRWQ